MFSLWLGNHGTRGCVNPFMHNVKLRLDQGFYVSLVGHSETQFPRRSGNYFHSDTQTIANMWHENLKHLIETGILSRSDCLDAVDFGGGLIAITDSRIPEGYLNKYPCFYGRFNYSPDELYRWFYPQFAHLPCLCGKDAEHKSLDSRSGTGRTSYRVCQICRRDAFFVDKQEVGREEYDVVYKELMGREFKLVKQSGK